MMETLYSIPVWVWIAGAGFIGLWTGAMVGVGIMCLMRSSSHDEDPNYYKEDSTWGRS